MNLRQKIKMAKRELRQLEMKGSGTYVLDIYEYAQQQSELQKIINHKRNFNQHYGWNETANVDMNKLTYIAIHSDFKELGVLVSPNGKPISMESADKFINNIIRTKMFNYAKEVAKEEKPTDKMVRKHIDYYLVLSSDRTKSKKVLKKKLFYQFKGDENIYRYQQEKKEDKASEKQTEKTPS